MLSSEHELKLDTDTTTERSTKFQLITFVLINILGHVIMKLYSECLALYH